MPRHRDAADTRRRERRRAAHPVQVSAGRGFVQVSVGIDGADLTPTEARALAGVLEAVAADVEARAPPPGAEGTRRLWMRDPACESCRGGVQCDDHGAPAVEGGPGGT